MGFYLDMHVYNAQATLPVAVPNTLVGDEQPLPEVGDGGPITSNIVPKPELEGRYLDMHEYNAQATLPTPTPNTIQGDEERGPTQPWYYHLYSLQIVDGTIEGGFVAGLTNIAVTIFNAWPEELNLTNVQVTGNPAVTAQFGEPRLVAAVADFSGVLVVDPSQTADLTIQATVTLTFTRQVGGDPILFVFDITVLAGTLESECPDTFTMQLRWRTVISSAANGREARKILRSLPSVSVRTSYGLNDGEERLARYEAYRKGLVSKVAVGNWMELTTVSETLLSGGTLLKVADLDFLSVGSGSAVLVDGELLSLQGKNVDGLTLSAPVAFDIPEGAEVLPILSGLPADDIASSIVANDIQSFQIPVTNIDNQLIASLYDGDTYLGSPVFELPPLIPRGGGHDLRIQSRGSTNARLIRDRFVHWENAKRSFSFGVDINTRTQWKEYLAFLFEVKGMGVPFWLRTPINDHTIVNPVVAGQSLVKITQSQEQIQVGDKVVLEQLLPNCTHVRQYRTIDSTSENITGDWDIVLDQVLSSDIDPVDTKIHKLLPCRLDSDTVNIQGHWPGRASSSLELVEVFNEL